MAQKWTPVLAQPGCALLLLAQTGDDPKQGVEAPIDMNMVAFLSRRLYLWALLLVLAWAARAYAQPLRVCAFGFNSHDEIAMLRAHLPPKDFDIIDLSAELLAAQNVRSARTSTSTAVSGPVMQETGSHWLQNVCRTGLRCDISVYSGEFAGGFFGRYGSSLTLEEMEEASCQPSCEGLFHQAQEVFLLACNTLATKDPDSRTPREYLDVLLDHGFDRSLAERVVELRYGPLGPSFGEVVRRIFMRVPRIYGFTSKAPNGQWTAAHLAKYFKAKGDYARYLERASGDTGPNKTLLTTFHGSSLAQTTGMTPSDPRAADRDAVCRVYDESRPVAQRLREMQRLLGRKDALSFLPTLEVFLNRHPPQQFQGEERRIFAAMQRQDAARQQVVHLVRELGVSALKMELAHLARQMEWITSDGFRRLAVDGARQLLARPLTSEAVDIMCEITKRQPLSGEFRSEDLPQSLFQDAEGLRLVACLSPADGRVGTRLLTGLDSSDVWARRWAAYALSKRLPLDDATLAGVASHLDDPAPDVRERLQWIFKTQRPLSRGIRAAVRSYDAPLADALGP